MNAMPTDGKQSHATLFNEYGTMGIRKIVQMKKTSDFEFDLVYGKTLTEEDKYVIYVHRVVTYKPAYSCKFSPALFL
jgi:hypothetical protein